ncbi:hypothetical protein MLD38_032211 [Melastoma candidum]|uniref:Uncharacterized protein n=1 Tax=Melastoma candidum TaxID=119954 RepID=A0ACB9M3K1_9MYRT|nr:hypothetical protein MLD38_032211 [Melastoma candidum]
MDRPVTREQTRRLSGPYSYIYKGASVEVTSKLEGCVDSWYEAKVLTLPKQPKSNFKSRREMHVVYSHLLREKGGTPLTERVDVSLVRPLPPRVVEDEVVRGFEVGDKVDTLDRDGWWTGVVNSVFTRVKEGKEEDRFVVRFDDPVHEIEFPRAELRWHLDWINGKWFVCRNGMSQELSVASDGCVTLASICHILRDLKHPIYHGQDVVMGICADRCTGMVLSNERGHPAKKIELTCMEYPSGHASGISDESTSEPHIGTPRLFDGSVNPVREHQRKVAGVHISSGFNRKCNTSILVKRIKRKRKYYKQWCFAGGKAKTEGVQNKTSVEEQSFDGTNLTREQRQGEVKIAKLRSCTSMEEQSSAAVGTDLTYKVQGNSLLVKSDGMSTRREEAEIVPRKGDPTRDDVAAGIPSMPFAKTSPVWHAVETLEIFQKFPQHPHFLPLRDKREGVREGLAIAEMVTFATVAENALKLSIDDPVNRFMDCLETLQGLKSHGFATKALENLVIKLVSLKEEHQGMEERKNEVQNQVSWLICENARLAEDIQEIFGKIRVYQDQLAAALLKKEERDCTLSILRTSLETMDTVMHRTRLDFEELTHSWYHSCL